MINSKYLGKRMGDWFGRFLAISMIAVVPGIGATTQSPPPWYELTIPGTMNGKAENFEIDTGSPCSVIIGADGKFQKGYRNLVIEGTSFKVNFSLPHQISKEKLPNGFKLSANQPDLGSIVLGRDFLAQTVLAYRPGIGPHLVPREALPSTLRHFWKSVSAAAMTGDPAEGYNTLDFLNIQGWLGKQSSKFPVSIDTGAESTFVPPIHALAADWVHLGNQKVYTRYGNEDWPTYICPSLMINGIGWWGDVKVTGLGLERKMNPQYINLGWDLLQNFRWILDIKTGKFYVQKPDSAKKKAKSSSNVPITISSPGSAAQSFPADWPYAITVPAGAICSFPPDWVPYPGPGTSTTWYPPGYFRK